MNEMMKVLYIQVGKRPQVIEIKHTLKEMQRLVGGIISAYSPFDDGSVIILNDTGKIDGLEFNRVVYNENGKIEDIIAGDFFICYAPPDRTDFSSLPDELIQKYSELFKTPKVFIKINGNVEMLYVIEKHDIKDIDVGNILPGTVSAISSARAKKVEMEIDQIDNPVVLTNDCNTKIVKAWNSYCALTGAEKLLVKNYETLVAAMKKYAELQRNSENDPVSAEVNEFTNKYSYALALTKLTATTEKDSNGNYKDIEALNTAIRALEGLSVQAQVILMPNKNTMKSVLYYLQEQIKEELEEAEAAERERKQREAAKEAVEDFLNQPYKWVLDLTVDKVTTDDETGVRTALSGLESAEINKYAIEMLAEKKKLLQDLLKKILELKINAEPEKAEAIISAEEFKNRFSSVLSLTPDSVTRDDEVDVNIANYAYELLSADAKLYLEKEGKLLASLMDAIASLPSDETENERHEEQDNDSNSAGNISETVKEVIKRIADNSQYSVKILERNMSNIVWVLLVAIGILSLNLIVCYGFYNKAKCQIKKYDLRGKSNGIE